MLTNLKYIPLLLVFKDISEAYREETGKEKPAWMSKRVIGLVVGGAGLFLTIAYGVQIAAEDVAKITDNINAILSSVATLYGAALWLKGAIGKYLKEVQAQKAECARKAEENRIALEKQAERLKELGNEQSG